MRLKCQVQAKGRCPTHFHFFGFSQGRAVPRLGHWSKEDERLLSPEEHGHLLMSCYLSKVKCALEDHVCGHLFSVCRCYLGRL